MGRVVVVGSLNTDHIVRVRRLPAEGQTVLGETFEIALGGKGATQAVAAARQGADVALVGCVGDDDDARALLQTLRAEGVDIGFVRHHGALPTGRAHVTVDATGRSAAVVVPGANAGASFPSAALDGASVVLVQLEIPLSTATAALAAAHARGVTTILNPSPARRLSDQLLDCVDYLVPNAAEAERLGEVAFAGTAIVTQGARGALVLRAGEPDRRARAYSVDVVDPSGAGDAFCGVFAAALAAGAPLPEAARRASAAGALACSQPGILPSLPTRVTVDELIASTKR